MIEKELVKTVKHISLATVNEDGTPHNTPLFFAVDDKFEHVYFVSRSDSLHTLNFTRTGRGFAALYDSNIFKGGVYLTLKDGHKTLRSDQEKAAKVFNEALKKWDVKILKNDFYKDDGGYNLYSGRIARIEVYRADVDSDGKVIVERREEVSAKELINE
jgi:general stress protein 26